MTHRLALEQRDVLVCSCGRVDADLPEALAHLRTARLGPGDGRVEAAEELLEGPSGKRPRCPVCHRSFRGKAGLAVHQARMKHAAGGNLEPATVE